MLSQETLEYKSLTKGSGGLRRRIPPAWRWKIWRETANSRYPDSPGGWCVGRSKSVPIAFTDTYSEAWETVDYLMARDRLRGVAR
jgi:hypothetical protein